jgi:hypothetical protein
MTKIALILAAILVLSGCGEEKSSSRKFDRFENSIKPASELGSIKRLTQDDRCIYPIFAPGDTIIYFRRLLAENSEAASGKEYEDLIKPFGININTGELLTLSRDYNYPAPNFIKLSELPKIAGETVTHGLISNDSSIIIMQAIRPGISGFSRIYTIKDSVLSQLTFGDHSCYLEELSNNGKYITALLDWDPSRILIINLVSGDKYKIEPEDQLLDYMAKFSSNDKMIVFIRSDKRYVLNETVFGDIWLFRFNE